MLRLLVWVIRKARREPENLLSLLLAAKRLEDDRVYTSIVFRAGYRVGQLNPCTPLDEQDD